LDCEPGLCWVHAERLVHKLDAFTDENRNAQRHIRGLIWRFYRDLKAYRLAPSEKRKASLMARFDRIFTRQTGFVTLDRELKRLHANKAELLKVLERPEIPLHTNGSENDIPLSRHQTQGQRWNAQRYRSRLPRRIPWPCQNLQKIGSPLLGLSRFTPRCFRPTSCPELGRDRQAPMRICLTISGLTAPSGGMSSATTAATAPSPRLLPLLLVSEPHESQSN
jgi:hypothetical protein